MLIGQAAPKDMGFDLRGKTHIPTQSRFRAQRSFPPDLYRRRNLVERCFYKLKQFNRECQLAVPDEAV